MNPHYYFQPNPPGNGNGDLRLVKHTAFTGPPRVVSEEFTYFTTEEGRALQESLAGTLLDGVGLIAIERAAQRRKWPDAHDDEHDDRELAMAAATLILGGYMDPGRAPRWALELFDKHAGPDAYARRLAIAGALIAAELDRVKRERVREKAREVAEREREEAERLRRNQERYGNYGGVGWGG
jgi:alcohol dehydrogenase YqhD (iron-dependent ADH family)